MQIRNAQFVLLMLLSVATASAVAMLTHFSGGAATRSASAANATGAATPERSSKGIPPKDTAPLVQATASIGSLPVTELPTNVAIIPLAVTDVTNDAAFPCTHYFYSKGRNSWPGTQEKPWAMSAMYGAKKAVLAKWSKANKRKWKLCGSQHYAPMQAPPQ